MSKISREANKYNISATVNNQNKDYCNKWLAQLPQWINISTFTKDSNNCEMRQKSNLFLDEYLTRLTSTLQQWSPEILAKCIAIILCGCLHYHKQINNTNILSRNYNTVMHWFLIFRDLKIMKLQKLFTQLIKRNDVLIVSRKPTETDLLVWRRFKPWIALALVSTINIHTNSIRTHSNVRAFISI